MNRSRLVLAVFFLLAIQDMMIVIQKATKFKAVVRSGEAMPGLDDYYYFPESSHRANLRHNQNQFETQSAIETVSLCSWL
jgi:hypothetical protein